VQGRFANRPCYPLFLTGAASTSLRVRSCFSSVRRRSEGSLSRSDRLLLCRRSRDVTFRWTARITGYSNASPKLKDDKHLSSFDADRILWAVMEITDRVAQGEISLQDLLDEISIASVPESAEEREDYGGWSAGAVRAGIEAVPLPPTRIRRSSWRWPLWWPAGTSSASSRRPSR
jgi:hypothetical protein